MSESTDLFLGNGALAKVLQQIKFVPNKPTHGRAHAGTGTRAFWLRRWLAMRNQAEAAASATNRLARPGGGPGPLKGYLGMYEMAMETPPDTGNCGEMALIAYRAIVKAALAQSFTIGAAAVQVTDISAELPGNHAFVLVGTDAAFRTLLAADPRRLTAPATAAPTTWGVEVAVVDAWIDDGKTAAFRATGLSGSGRSLWADYLARVAAQAECKATAQAIKAGDTITLTVDDSITITAQR